VVTALGLAAAMLRREGKKRRFELCSKTRGFTSAPLSLLSIQWKAKAEVLSYAQEAAMSRVKSICFDLTA
jgi:hypothetical protein